MYRSGKDKESLFNAVKELESVTAVDSVIKKDQQVILTGVMQNGKLKNWRLKENPKFFKQDKGMKGKTYNSLADALEVLESVEDSNPMISVICYYDTLPERTWEGKIKSRWYVLSPSQPYELNGNLLRLQTVTIEVSEEQYAMMLDTRLGFYDEESGDVYPFKRAALQSIGRFLDANTIFNKAGDVPLGAAMILADKMGNVNSWKFIYRNAEDNIKPLVAMTSSKFFRRDQKKFIDDCFSGMNQIGVAEVDNWVITDESTVVELHFNMIFGENLYTFTPTIRLEVSDVPGVPTTISAFGKVGSGLIYADRIVVDKDTDDVKGIFLGLPESFRYINDALQWDRLKNNLPDMNSSSAIKRIQKIIGKERSKKLGDLKECNSGVEYITSIVNLTWGDFSLKQKNELSEAYVDVIKELCV